MNGTPAETRLCKLFFWRLECARLRVSCVCIPGHHPFRSKCRTLHVLHLHWGNGGIRLQQTSSTRQFLEFPLSRYGCLSSSIVGWKASERTNSRCRCSGGKDRSWALLTTQAGWKSVVIGRRRCHSDSPPPPHHHHHHHPDHHHHHHHDHLDSDITMNACSFLESNKNIGA